MTVPGIVRRAGAARLEDSAPSWAASGRETALRARGSRCQFCGREGSLDHAHIKREKKPGTAIRDIALRGVCPLQSANRFRDTEKKRRAFRRCVRWCYALCPPCHRKYDGKAGGPVVLPESVVECVLTTPCGEVALRCEVPFPPVGRSSAASGSAPPVIQSKRGRPKKVAPAPKSKQKAAPKGRPRTFV